MKYASRPKEQVLLQEDALTQLCPVRVGTNEAQYLYSLPEKPKLRDMPED